MIIATRPLLLSVLKERLDNLGCAEEDWRKFLVLPHSLISIGIKSAIKTLEILRDENCLLGACIHANGRSFGYKTDKTSETFLPFDLEFAYAAALHLTMANSLFSPSSQDRTYSKAAHSIFDELISHGNRVAEARKANLTLIENLFQQFTNRVHREGLQVLTLTNRGDADTGWVHNDHRDHPGAASSTTEHETESQSSTNDMAQFSTEPLLPAEALDHIGISSYEFLTIVNQIDNPVATSSILDAGREWV